MTAKEEAKQVAFNNMKPEEDDKKECAAISFLGLITSNGQAPLNPPALVIPDISSSTAGTIDKTWSQLQM